MCPFLRLGGVERPGGCPSTLPNWHPILAPGLAAACPSWRAGRTGSHQARAGHPVMMCSARHARLTCAPSTGTFLVPRDLIPHRQPSAVSSVLKTRTRKQSLRELVRTNPAQRLHHTHSRTAFIMDSHWRLHGRVQLNAWQAGSHVESSPRKVFLLQNGSVARSFPRRMPAAIGMATAKRRLARLLMVRSDLRKECRRCACQHAAVTP